MLMKDRSSRTKGDTVCFHAGWLIDGTGDPTRRDVLLRVAKGRIVSLEPATEPSPVPVADLSGCTILPALVDSHVHLFMSGTQDSEVRQRQLAQPYGEAKAVIARHLRGHYLHGVLAVRDGGDYGGYSLQYRNENFGDFPPVRVRAPGKAWRATRRYGSLIGRPPPEGRTLGEALGDALDRQGPERPDHVKIVQSGLNSLLRWGW